MNRNDGYACVRSSIGEGSASVLSATVGFDVESGPCWPRETASVLPLVQKGSVDPVFEKQSEFLLTFR